MCSRNITVTKLLIDSGAKLHEEDLNGRQPIHVAAEEGQGDLIIELANGGNYLAGFCNAFNLK